MESRRLSDFLAALSDDDDQLDRYRSDPQAFLANADIEHEHRELLLSGDVRSIRAVLREEHELHRPGGAAPCFVVVFRS